MSLPRTLDEIEYRLPARYVIRFRDVSRRVRMAAIHLRYWRDRLARQVLWITAIAGVLAYLAVAAWIENRDLVYGEQVRDRAIAILSSENAELRRQRAEQDATRTRKLIYMIEAGSADEAKDKLSRIAMLVAGERFAMDEATEATRGER
jgi:hypothetical protein